jgi:hypothetical protein
MATPSDVSPSVNPQPIRLAWGLLARHMALIYPLLVFSVLVNGLIPHNQALALTWPWVLLLLLLVALHVAFTCGWYGCVFSVVLQAMSPQSQTTPAPSLLPDTFKHFNVFIPTVGRYFGVMLQAALLMSSVPVGLGLLGLAVLQATVGLFTQWPQGAQLTSNASLRAWANTLTEAQQLQLTLLVLLIFAVVAVAGVSQWFAPFWLQGMMLRQQNPWHAYCRSVVLVFRRLGPLLLVGIPVTLLTFCCMFLSATGADILKLVGTFALTLVELFWLLYTTVLFVQTHTQVQLFTVDDGPVKASTSSVG